MQPSSLSHAAGDAVPAPESKGLTTAGQATLDPKRQEISRQLPQERKLKVQSALKPLSFGDICKAVIAAAGAKQHK